MEGLGPEQPGNTPREAAEELAVSAEAVTEISASAAAALDPRLPPHRLRLLSVIQRRPGVNLTGLAESMGLTLSRASRVCSAMEAAGLLERRPVTTDRREIELALAPRGAALLTDYQDRRAGQIAEVIRRMPASDLGDLLTGLRSFAASLAAVRDGRG
ncbi:MarR family winged helix-turn-helix transcriptional regulator [Streptomyces sp. NPDC088725]|uniref:MarR family winged helix-turn-helix transcriptional regulator n=1 Tax=Streptomyces sp. NPDC088725 TaxID=3365873 RepID=UPI00381D2E75